ncbi:ATP-binding cassette, sub-B (MDR TAP), member 4, partial [Cladochytrium tenue]
MAGKKVKKVIIPPTNDDATTTADATEAADVATTKAVRSVPYTTLYRFATRSDWLLMAVGTVAAAVVGVTQPLVSIVFNSLTTTLVTYPYSTSPTRDDELIAAASQAALHMIGIGVAALVCAFTFYAAWNVAGERQARRLREEYLAAILRQDVAWFDQTATGDLTARITADTLTVQGGISHKVALIVMSISTFISGFAIAFTKGPELAGVLCSAFPLLGLTGFLISKTMARQSTAGAKFYAAAGGVAQEVLAGIRTVTAFHTQKREMTRYSAELKKAEAQGVQSAIVSGLSTGAAMGIIFLTYALGFYYGGIKIDHGYTAGDVFNVFFAIMIGAMSLSQVGTQLSDISAAVGVASKIFETIDRASLIDSSSADGLKPKKVNSVIEFNNLNFSYPQRPDVLVLKNFSLRVQPGQTVALVGASGSGKSTVVKLLERFYDPDSGTVTLDGQDLRSLNVRWLREQIGIVSQEPVLFDKTVRENIIYGMREDDAALGKIDATRAAKLRREVEEACRLANAWGFVSALPRGLDTSVGDTGGMMSGGQKQRIAIARAMMRDPAILLLDEATSALDTQSERAVQKALDSAAKNRTTIVIAHRLSTIKNADLIVVMKDGEIVEQGTHQSLMALPGGVYASLVAVQQLKEVDDIAAVGEGADSGERSSSSTTDDSVEAADLTVALQQNKQEESTNVTKSEEQPVQTKSGSGGWLRMFRGRGGQDTKVDVETGGDDDSNDSDIGEKPTDDISTRIAKRKEAERRKKSRQARLARKPLDWARLYRLSAPEWPLYFVGALCSCCTGVVLPLFALVMSTLLNVFAEEEDQRTHDLRFWALMFVVLALGYFLVNTGSISCFGTGGSRLTRRLREMAFASILRQEMAFFDHPRHSTGALTGRLAEDATRVEGLIGRTMAAICSTTATMICGLFIAFYYGPVLTVIILTMSGYGSKAKEEYEGASIIANEAIDQIRTVAALTKESVFHTRYRESIALPYALAVRGSVISAMGFAFSQGFIFFAYALAFYSGVRLVLDGIMLIQGVFKVVFAVIFTAVSLSQGLALAPNYIDAKLAALEIFRLVDRRSVIDPLPDAKDSASGIQKGPDEVDGSAGLQAVEFKYPLRPDVPVLRGLDLDVVAGRTVALVGASGCGKSTVIALLERWYDALAGRVTFGDAAVQDWRVVGLREHMALVGQEPVLFNMSIRDNIAYGAPEGSTTQEDIERVANMANIHSFVTSLPEGYGTIVGAKGGQLSGGQKQRVAIARALIRNPKLLLLDEATSALDSESERVVQAALDSAARGRTTVVIAHRLSTVQGSADLVAVVDSGRVVEHGTFDDLVRAGGVLAELVAAQSLAVGEVASDAATVFVDNNIPTVLAVSAGTTTAPAQTPPSHPFAMASSPSMGTATGSACTEATNFMFDALMTQLGGAGSAIGADGIVRAMWERGGGDSAPEGERGENGAAAPGGRGPNLEQPMDATAAGAVHGSMVAAAAAAVTTAPFAAAANGNHSTMAVNGSALGGLGLDGRRRALQTLACDRCREKKRRCDGKRPICSSCSRALVWSGEDGTQVVCVYQPAFQKRGRKRRNVSGADDSIAQEGKAPAAGQIESPPGDTRAPSHSDSLLTVPGSVGSGVLTENVDSPHYFASLLDPPGKPSTGNVRLAGATPLVSPPTLEEELLEFASGLAQTNAAALEALCREPQADIAALFAPLQPAQTVGDAAAARAGSPDSTSLVLGSRRMSGVVPSVDKRQISLMERMLLSEATSWPTTAPIWDLPDSLLKAPPMPMMNLSEIHLGDDLFRSIDFSGIINPEVTTVRDVLATSHEAYNDLTTHLIAVFFYFFNPLLRIFCEEDFLSNFYPVNTHPESLIFAIMGYTAPFSKHPELFRKYKTPMRASRHFVKVAGTKIDGTSDVISSIQAMLLLSSYEYEPFVPFRFAFRKNAKLALNDEHIRIRRRLLLAICELDMRSLIVSGLPPAFRNEVYQDVMLRWEEEWRKKQAADSTEGEMEGGNGLEFVNNSCKEWSRIFAAIPEFTVYDKEVYPYPHPLSSSYSVVCDLRRRFIPPQLQTDDSDDMVGIYYLNLLIRNLQYVRTRAHAPADFTSRHILNSLPGVVDQETVHNSIIAWFADLPEHVRLFPSFEVFSEVHPGGRPHLDPALPALSRPTWLGINVFIILSMVWLHDPCEQPSSSPGSSASSLPLFRLLPTESSRRITSAQWGVLAHRAMIHFLQLLFLKAGQPVPYTSSRPPPPLAIPTASLMVPSKEWRLSRDSAMRNNWRHVLPGAERSAGDGEDGGDSDSGAGHSDSAGRRRGGVYSRANPAPPLFLMANLHIPFAMFACALNLVSAVVPDIHECENYQPPAVLPAVDNPWTGILEVRDIYIPILESLSHVFKSGKIYGEFTNKLLDRAVSYRLANTAAGIGSGTASMELF